jgi:hypothetical protein
VSEHPISPHVDDTDRIAFIEARTRGNEPSFPALLVRHQPGNHLRSTVLERDDLTKIIAHEELTPFGVTVYQAVRSQTETPKRYRFIGRTPTI